MPYSPNPCAIVRRSAVYGRATHLVIEEAYKPGMGWVMPKERGRHLSRRTVRALKARGYEHIQVAAVLPDGEERYPDFTIRELLANPNK